MRRQKIEKPKGSSILNGGGDKTAVTPDWWRRTVPDYLVICILVVSIVALTSSTVTSWLFSFGSRQHGILPSSKAWSRVRRVIERDMLERGNLLVDENGRKFSPRNVSLYAEIRRRRRITARDEVEDEDGLVIVRPLGWYIYYQRGGTFYYLNGTLRADDGRPCGVNESAAIALNAIDDNSKTTSDLHTGCMNVSPTALNVAFSESSPYYVVLDDILVTDNTHRNEVTVVSVLNTLIDRKLL